VHHYQLQYQDGDGSLLEISKFSSCRHGDGVSCDFQGNQIVSGNANCIMDHHHLNLNQSNIELIHQLEEQGHTVIIVGENGVAQGAICLKDTIRPEAKTLIHFLKTRMNIRKIYMLSGDNQYNVDIIAEEVGLEKENCHGRLSPIQKVAKIKDLQTDKSNIVGMIGDGVNDAAALVASEVGIAVGVGTHIAIDAANVVLMKDNLLHVAVALDIARKTFTVIKMNFLWAIIYNIIAIPLASGMVYPLLHFRVPPELAGFSELLSSVPVVLFSMILGFYQSPRVLKL